MGRFGGHVQDVAAGAAAVLPADQLPAASQPGDSDGGEPAGVQDGVGDR